MAFELRQITEADLQIIFPEKNDKIKDKRKATRDDYLSRDIVGRTWARDEKKDAFLIRGYIFQYHIGGMGYTYTFGWGGDGHYCRSRLL